MHSDGLGGSLIDVLYNIIREVTVQSR